MPIELKMPALSPTMEEGTLARWLVKEGDKVSSGDLLAEIETDKATMEFEAVDEGVIGKILIAAGTEGVKVNTAIAVLLEDGEDASAAVASSAPAEAAAPAAAKAPAEAKGPVATSVPQSPDWAEGTKMKQMTVREALREGMSEEMRRDASVFILGERLAQAASRLARGDDDEPRRKIQRPRAGPIMRKPRDGMRQQRRGPRQKMTADVGGRRHHSGKVHHARRAAREVQTRSACEGSIFNYDRDRRGEYGGSAGEKKQNPAAGRHAGFYKKEGKRVRCFVCSQVFSSRREVCTRGNFF